MNAETLVTLIVSHARHELTITMSSPMKPSTSLLSVRGHLTKKIVKMEKVKKGEKVVAKLLRKFSLLTCVTVRAGA